MKMVSRLGPWWLLCLAALSVQAHPAAAQDALGSGSALDRNLHPGSGGYNAPTPQIDYRVRNLLVTDDVPGGRGFRGSVGYRAVGDFSGELGSDDLFQFRAGSAFSALPYITSGLTGERLRFGEAMALSQISYRRSTSQLPQDPTARPDVQDGLYVQDRIQMDRFIQATSSTEQIDAAARPRVIGVAIDREGQTLLAKASSLRGISIKRAEDDSKQAGLTFFDQMRLREDDEAGKESVPPGTPFQIRFEPESARIGAGAGDGEGAEGGGAAGAAGTGVLVEPIAGRIEAVEGPDYARILKSLVKRYAESDNVKLSIDAALVGQLDGEYQSLRRQLIGGEAEERAEAGADRTRAAGGAATPPGAAARPPTPAGGLPSAATPGATPASPGTPGQLPSVRPPAIPGVTPIPAPDEGDKTEGEDEEGGEEADAADQGLEKFGVLLRHGERVEALAREGDQGRFDELLRSAEDRLRKGEYFWAERRFIRALRFVPGHPLATAGLGHAQIGAGLYGSAALTLRSLLTYQPEMIDVLYDEGLLPTRVRILKAIEELRSSPQTLEDRSHRGFVLAYLGHQIADTALVREGLGLMKEANASDPLLQLLEKVWVPETGAPAPGK